MFRYSTALSMAVAGVSIRFSKGLQKTKPKTVSTNAMREAPSQAVRMAVWRSLYCFPPKKRAMSTEQPVLKPTATAV